MCVCRWWWGGSRCQELKVNMCRHNGEGLSPRGLRSRLILLSSRPPIVSDSEPLQSFVVSAPHAKYSAKVSLVDVVERLRSTAKNPGAGGL